MYRKITSASNSVIKEALAIKMRRGRYRERAFLVEGLHLVEAALAAGSHPKRIFFISGFGDTVENRKILRLLADASGESYEVTERILRKITDTETPQGIVAIMSCKALSLENLPIKKDPFIVVIDGIQDPGNLGTIIRTSDAAGSDAILLLSGTCDAFMPKTVRATAGSLFNIPLVYPERSVFRKWLQNRKIKLVATAVDAKKTIFDANLTGPAAFVLGNEARGVCKEIRESADLVLKIPIFGKAESLNVATSAAVLLYEAVRQRTIGEKG